MKINIGQLPKLDDYRVIDHFQIEQLTICKKLMIHVNDTANDDIMAHVDKACDFIDSIITSGGSGEHSVRISFTVRSGTYQMMGSSEQQKQ